MTFSLTCGDSVQVKTQATTFQL